MKADFNITPTRFYCEWEGVPVVYDLGEGWAFINNAWKRVDSADVAQKARRLSKETFSQMFDHVPDLPSTAFQDGSSRAAAAS